MTLWGGRFESAPDRMLWEYTVDQSDRRLLIDDIRGSMAHLGMLGAQQILTDSDVATIQNGLEGVLAEAVSDSFEFLETDEDVHSAVERRLIELVGDVGKRLHTGRSRNDQIALDVRLYLARSGREQIHRIARFASVLLDQAERVGETIVPSYTHLQQAQAVPLAHHLLAYAEMLRRDAARFEDVVGRLEVSPLGAGPSGGSSLALDPLESTRLLGWRWHFVNSMDAVGSRDVVAEYVFVCGQAMIDLSRLAEEITLWASAEFGWLTIDDAFSTGSSAMPQKKNPDIAELVRGRAAVVIGDVTAALALQKGLPMTYNRDFQEDKRLVFHADDTLAGSLAALGGLIATATFHPPLPDPGVTALDLAEALVERGVPFREAHEAVGRLVSRMVATGQTLADVSGDDLAAADDRFVLDDLDRIDAADSVSRRVTPGGGSFEEVHRQIERIRRQLADTLG